MRNPYRVLEVSNEASTEVIDAAYRRLARKYHPDSGEAPDADRMVQINGAYEVLRDPEQRARFDRRKASTRKKRPPRRTADALLRRASEAIEREDWSQARTFATEALELEPDNIDALLDLAEVAVAEDDDETLLRVTDHALSLEPDNCEALLYAAEAAGRDDAWLDARGLAASVLILTPGDAEARELWDTAQQRLREVAD